MIQPLITTMLILPILIGILSVDADGNKFGVRDWLKENVLSDRVVDALQSYIGTYDYVGNQTDLNQPLLDIPSQADNSIDEFTSNVIDGVVFIILQGRDFGIWIGMSTAPFHYLIAAVMTFSFAFPMMWLYIIGFFYIVISENKEIRQEIFRRKNKP